MEGEGGRKGGGRFNRFSLFFFLFSNSCLYSFLNYPWETKGTGPWLNLLFLFFSFSFFGKGEGRRGIEGDRGRELWVVKYPLTYFSK